MVFSSKVWPLSPSGSLVSSLSPVTLAMDQPAGLQVDYVFRGVEHAVRVVVSGQVLELEVEDRMTADQWRGEFDASFIEDLTHKTGNFKQFNIFCNMLESALTQSSESVTLDLLTYTDLESLRNRKLGGRPSTLAPRSNQLNSKRYLILIYSVEFDRIHYPLPLPYQGKPDPVVLQGIIRSLKEELGRLRGLDGQDARDSRETEIWHLREQVSRLASEKRELEAQLGRSREEALAGRAARQEAEALRGLVRGLELELRQERGLGHRGAGRRSQDCRRLAKELEEVKASERSLRSRLKTLNCELALYKRGRRSSPAVPPPAREGRASSSRERSTSRGRAAARSSSRESGHGIRGRGRPARPSPSPTGGRVTRFDPTAFVKAKEKKQKEIRMKLVRILSSLPLFPSGTGSLTCAYSLATGVPASYQPLSPVTCSMSPLPLPRSHFSPDPTSSPDPLLNCLLVPSPTPNLVWVPASFSSPRTSYLWWIIGSRSDALPALVGRTAGRLLFVFFFFFFRQQQQQRNRLGSGGSGDGPSISWSRQTRPPAAVTGRGDAANRSRNRSSSVDSFRSRCSSASSCSEFEDFSESLSRGLRRGRGKPPSPTPWSASNMKCTSQEHSNHRRRLANSGGWVPIKEYSSDHQAADMAEIDARLKALQEYMNRLDTRS
ncbi:coiled-coil domain-containing protein 61 [Marmota monax]|uniref:Centrosomal protein CCDC61 n=2 Tax=Marmota monax TaxID=9995 RepID=A0A834Q5K2_MARMO|nr:coiled-coil domain-containing protein 61 [Marmota monax]